MKDILERLDNLDIPVAMFYTLRDARDEIVELRVRSYELLKALESAEKELRIAHECADNSRDRIEFLNAANTARATIKKAKG